MTIIQPLTVRIGSAFKLPLLMTALLFGITACSTSGGEKSGVARSKISFSNLSYSWDPNSARYRELINGPLAGEIGASLSRAAKRKAMNAEYEALENGKSGQSTIWQYSAEQNGAITPFPPYQVGSSNCRRYVHMVTTNGKSLQATATACRDAEGNWKPLT